MPDTTAVITATHSAMRAEHEELLQVILAEDQQQDRDDLRHHLDLAERRGGNDDAARVGDAAQHRDRELAAEDHRDHPGRREVHLHQRHAARR